MTLARPQSDTPANKPEDKLDDFKRLCKVSDRKESARESWKCHLQVSCLTGIWVVLLMLPVVVWPFSDYITDVFNSCSTSWVSGTPRTNFGHCEALAGCHWNATAGGTITDPSCVGSIRGFLHGTQGFWGTMLLQFVFSVGTTVGGTTKATLQGLIGTVLACINMGLLNAFIDGGAHGDRSSRYEVVLPDGSTTLNSPWLPLCNNGFHEFDTEQHQFAQCIFNVWLTKATTPGLTKCAVVCIDFVVYVFLCMKLPFDTNTRVFALSTHIYFMMCFLDPNSKDFATFPQIHVNYLLMILFASFSAWMLSMILRYTAFGEAERLLEDEEHGVTTTIAALMASMHGTTGKAGELVRRKAESVLVLAEKLLEEAQSNVTAAWFEANFWDLGLGKKSDQRKRLKFKVKCLKKSLDLMKSVHFLASQLSTKDINSMDDSAAPDLLEQDRSVAAIVGPNPSSSGSSPSNSSVLPVSQSLRDFCHSASKVVENTRNFREDNYAEQFDQSDSYQFKKAQDELMKSVDASQSLSPKAKAFICIVSGVGSGAVDAVKTELVNKVPNISKLTLWYQMKNILLLQRLQEYVFVKDGSDGSSSDDQTGFVLRNTFSICFSFFIGWIGLWNILPSYSSYVASTISVLMFRFAGSSINLTIKRVAGVVLGKVIGTTLQLGLAMEDLGAVFMYVVTVWVAIFGSFFLYLQCSAHGETQASTVFCLIAGFVACSMVPSSGELRKPSTSNFSDITPALLFSIICTAVGVAIIVWVDFLFAHKALHFVREDMLECFGLLREVVTKKKEGNLPAQEHPTKDGGEDMLECFGLLREVVTKMKEGNLHAQEHPKRDAQEDAHNKFTQRLGSFGVLIPCAESESNLWGTGKGFYMTLCRAVEEQFKDLSFKLKTIRLVLNSAGMDAGLRGEYMLKVDRALAFLKEEADKTTHGIKPTDRTHARVLLNNSMKLARECVRNSMKMAHKFRNCCKPRTANGLVVPLLPHPVSNLHSDGCMPLHKTTLACILDGCSQCLQETIPALSWDPLKDAPKGQHPHKNHSFVFELVAVLETAVERDLHLVNFSLQAS